MRKDRFEEITSTEMQSLERAEGKDAPASALMNALDLLTKLEEQKGQLEAREQIQEQEMLAQRVSDAIANFSGSIIFIIAHLLIFGSWIFINTAGIVGIPQFDPFPFLFLTFTVSLEAIILSSFILLSQNRQSIRDRTRDEIDFERDRLDLKVDTLAAKGIHEATIRIANIEKQLEALNKKLGKRKN
jgi:uncharacterized membrane protein